MRKDEKDERRRRKEAEESGKWRMKEMDHGCHRSFAFFCLMLFSLSLWARSFVFE